MGLHCQHCRPGGTRDYRHDWWLVISNIVAFITPHFIRWLTISSDISGTPGAAFTNGLTEIRVWISNHTIVLRGMQLLTHALFSIAMKLNRRWS